MKKSMNRITKLNIGNFIISCVKGLISFTRKIKKIKREFRKSEYLVEGRYSFNTSFDYIYLKDDENKKRASSLLDNSDSVLSSKKNSNAVKTIKVMIGSLYSWRLHKRKNKTSNFSGTIFMLGGGGRNNKIFDLENKKVLTQYKYDDDYNKAILLYKQFHSCFKMPKVLHVDSDESVIIEEFIDFKNFEDWSQTDFKIVINDLHTSVHSYVKEQKKNNEIAWKSINDLLQEVDRENLFAFINELQLNIDQDLKDKKYPYLFLHGDMWTSNILIKKEDNSIRYIDFEYANYYIFFWDLFFIMWNEYIRYNTTYYLSEYISGSYDKLFRNLFTLFDLNYEEDKKMDYIHMFILEFYQERWNNVDDDGLEQAYTTYKEFIKVARKVNLEKKEIKL